MKKACILVGFALLIGFGWTEKGNARTVSVTLPTTAVTQPQETSQSAPQSIEFPCVLGNAGLIVTDLVSFEGLTPESGQEEFVMDALALLIYNPGKLGIIGATITLTRGDETLYFELEYLPAGSRALVVERNQKAYEDGTFDSCRCESYEKGAFSPETPDIRITYENGNLSVQNISDTSLPSVTIYYKQYTPEDGFYVGGRAMCADFGSLQPGEAAAQEAYGYIPDYSRIAAIIIGK